MTNNEFDNTSIDAYETANPVVPTAEVDYEETLAEVADANKSVEEAYKVEHTADEDDMENEIEEDDLSADGDENEIEEEEEEEEEIEEPEEGEQEEELEELETA